jgi:hypothetical protein
MDILLTNDTLYSLGYGKNFKPKWDMLPKEKNLFFIAIFPMISNQSIFFYFFQRLSLFSHA